MRVRRKSMCATRDFMFRVGGGVRVGVKVAARSRQRPQRQTLAGMRNGKASHVASADDWSSHGPHSSRHPSHLYVHFTSAPPRRRHQPPIINIAVVDPSDITTTSPHPDVDAKSAVVGTSLRLAGKGRGLLAFHRPSVTLRRPRSQRTAIPSTIHRRLGTITDGT